jgi:hypothetical protein
MSIDELTAAESMHQEALAAIVQRKKCLLEEWLARASVLRVLNLG